MYTKMEVFFKEKSLTSKPLNATQFVLILFANVIFCSFMTLSVVELHLEETEGGRLAKY